MPYINRDICSHFYRCLNKKWRYSNICCIEKFLKSLFIVLLTLYVALYFCKAINVENKWKGKPSLLRVLFVLFKVGEKMQNKRMFTRIYHLSAVLSTAPTSNRKWSSSAPYLRIASCIVSCLLFCDLYRVVGASNVFLKCKQMAKKERKEASWSVVLLPQVDVKKTRLNDNRAACLSIQAFPANLACNKERGAGWKGALLPLPQRAGSQATLLLF